MVAMAAWSDRPWWWLPAAVLAGGLILSVPFWTGDADLVVARWWQEVDRAQGGAWHQTGLWRVAYHVPGVLVAGFILGGLWCVVRGLASPGHRRLLRPGLYLLIALALGPGLVVNTILKDHWGRPRPRETAGLGGVRDYHPPWVIGPAGSSFPCGHATVPALGLALAMLWWRERRRLALAAAAGTAVITAWVAAARMLAGAHYLSDVLWGVVLVWLISAGLHRLIVQPAHQAQGPPAGMPSRTPVLAAAGPQ